MRTPEDNFKIEIDLDRDRIRTILSESYDICKDYLCTDFEITKDNFVSRIEPYLSSNRVSIPVLIDLPCKSYPGIRIEVNLRRRKINIWMYPKKTQAILNHLLKGL